MVASVHELGAGAGSGQWVIAETSTSPRRDPKAKGAPPGEEGGQDHPLEIARAIEAAEPFLGGLTASVGEDGELGGRGDVGAVENAERSAIAIGQEAWIDDDPTGWCGCRAERADHGSVGSRCRLSIPAHATGGREPDPETPIAGPIPAVGRRRHEGVSI